MLFLAQIFLHQKLVLEESHGCADCGYYHHSRKIRYTDIAFAQNHVQKEGKTGNGERDKNSILDEWTSRVPYERLRPAMRAPIYLEESVGIVAGDAVPVVGKQGGAQARQKRLTVHDTSPSSLSDLTKNGSETEITMRFLSNI
jgi:hypothetical protein